VIHSYFKYLWIRKIDKFQGRVYLEGR